MMRRGFHTGLLALPFVAPIARVARAIKARLFPVVYMGAAGEDGARTLTEAFAKVQPGGIIVVMPGEYEVIDGELFKSDVMVIGSGDRPNVRWRA